CGQTNPNVKFLSRGHGYTVYLTSTDAVLSTSAEDEPLSVRMRLIGASSPERVVGVEELPGKVNYFIGSDPGKWRTNISTYQTVRSEEVYPGIDLVYYGRQGQFEYDFIIKPGADPSAIRIAFQGVGKFNLNGDGDLVLSTKRGQLTQKKPIVYQEL